MKTLESPVLDRGRSAGADPYTRGRKKARPIQVRFGSAARHRQAGASIRANHRLRPVARIRSGSVIVPLVVVVSLLGSVRAAEPRQGNFGDESLKVDSDQREYRLVVPKTVDLKKPVPLVFAFHGLLIDSK